MDTNNDWFDYYLPRVRNMRAWYSDEDLARRLVTKEKLPAEQVFLLVKAAKLLDG